jgi:hypothetical protein
VAGGLVMAGKLIRLHKVKIRKPLEVSNGKMVLIIPRNYEFEAKIRSYQYQGREVNDFEAQKDGNLFQENILFQLVGCDHLQFVD